VGDIACCPSLQEVRFELTGVDKFPRHRIEGRGFSAMQIEDVTTLWYNEAEGAATRVTMVKKGKMIVLRFDSRYKLPSGKEEPMSLPKIRLKQRITKRLLAERKSTAIYNEQKALDRVQNVARALDRTKGISFRFYTVVAEHEVDLLIAK